MKGGAIFVSMLLSASGFLAPGLLQAAENAVDEVRLLDTSTGDGSAVSGYAHLWGRGIPGGGFFYVAEIDGVAEKTNNLSQSRAASLGRGRSMNFKSVEHSTVPGKHRIKLVGRYEFAAPIDNFFRSAASYAVEGEVEVDLTANARYRVTGVLEPLRQEVWLEEIANGRVIGPKIINATVENERIKAMEGASYTCCNLRYSDDWISDANAATLPFIPAGARIVIKDYGRNRIHVLIDGQKMTIGHDYGRKQETREQFVAKLLVNADPSEKIATYDPAIQRAIRAGKVRAGMNKEQAIISLGYPRTDLTASLDAPAWKYLTADEDEYELVWGSDGLLAEVRAKEAHVPALILLSAQ